jgi:hypothetical protein
MQKLVGCSLYLPKAGVRLLTAVTIHYGLFGDRFDFLLTMDFCNFSRFFALNSLKMRFKVQICFIAVRLFRAPSG